MFRFEMGGICFAFSVNSKARSLDLGTEQNVKVFTWLECGKKTVLITVLIAHTFSG